MNPNGYTVSIHDRLATHTYSKEYDLAIHCYEADQSCPCSSQVSYLQPTFVQLESLLTLQQRTLDETPDRPSSERQSPDLRPVAY
jgi:hypothetical protein